MMTRVWHWLVLGALVLYSWPVVHHVFGEHLDEADYAIGSISWFICCVLCVKGAWTTLMVGWRRRIENAQDGGCRCYR